MCNRSACRRPNAASSHRSSAASPAPCSAALSAAAATGAIAGAVVGDRVDNRQTAAAPPAQRCHTVETIRDVIRDYAVVYQYNGRDIATTMPHDPGPTVRVGVTALDGAGAAPAPTAAMMGNNVREVAAPAESRAPATHDTRSPQSSYSYRY